MKKAGILLIAFCMTLSALSGCASQSAALSEPGASPIPSPSQDPSAEGVALTEQALPTDGENPGILLSPKPKTLTTEMKQFSLLIANNTDRDYSTDYVQKLMKRTDEVWTEVPLLTEAVSLALLVIPAGEIVDIPFDLEYHYDPLEPGTYRIYKTFVDSDGGLVEAYCEFDLF